ELGRQMSTTLDTDRIVELTADLLLPVLGDACAVDLVEDDAPLFRQVTRASATNGGDRSTTTATEITPPAPVSEVLRSGRLLRYPVVPAGLIDDVDTERTGSALVVPMRARGQTVGAVSLARFGASRGYEPDDVAFAVEAAGRMGVALDNARLFERQRDAAMAMQHALLPQRLPTLPGVELAARYIAGSADTEVGGDWFDVIPLPDGSLAVVIGDVMGRGVRAAAVMGQLRAAVRAYALLDLAPSRLLWYLDRVVALLDDVQLVTCLYGVLDPDTGAFRYAKAGHHPPLMRRADRSVAVLDSPPAPPLGLLDMVDSRPVEYATRVPAGATLLFYTDGLVEERQVDLGKRHEQLQRSLGEVDGHPERLVEQLLAAMGRTGEHTDDVAVLAVHRPAVVAPDVDTGAEAQLTVTDAPESVSTARHFLAGVLTEWGLAALRDTAALLVSETVTNALLHAHSAADVRVRRTAHGVEVEVRDHDDRLPAPREPEPDDESGRGLRLVEQLSAAWGAEPSYAGKRVWFRLDLPDA
ncbi:MAG: SpoIIE family protein phosphatase, partial [Streptosporangiales bacterium]|nr:SpoIIE family protein phosphatase [Streptosporangiales bacterium]